MAPRPAQYKTDVHNDWCPGCGDFGIINAIQMALAEMSIPNEKAALFSGIGCSGKSSHFVNVYGIHTLHGRVLTFAQGAKIANPNITVIAAGGDGDGLGIGAGHFVAAGRRNVDMTYIIFDNGVYGLTKGQASPTLRLGEKTKSLSQPNTSYNVNPIGLAVTSGFTFVARSYSYDIRHLKDMLVQAVSHKGLAFIDVLQPCPTYNDINTRDWYSQNDAQQPRIYDLHDSGYDGVVHYDDTNYTNKKIADALVRSLEWGQQIPVGVFYQNEFIAPYSRRVKTFKNPPALQEIARDGAPLADIDAILDSMRV